MKGMSCWLTAWVLCEIRPSLLEKKCNGVTREKCCACVASIQLFLFAFGLTYCLHSCTLGDQRSSMSSTQAAAEQESYRVPLPLLWRSSSLSPSRCSTPRLAVTLNLNNKADDFKSRFRICLESELLEWQGREIRRGAFVNNKYLWSGDEGRGDLAAKEGKRWFNIKSQQTSPPHWGKPIGPTVRKHESASAETCQINRNPCRVKG